MRRPSGPDWLIEWSDSPFSQKTVVLIDPVAGRRSVGHDWLSWDRALRMAIDNTGLKTVPRRWSDAGPES